MNTPARRLDSRPETLTLALGAHCYGVTAVTHERPVALEPLPPSATHGGGCALVRLGDGVGVPVFDLRSRTGKAGRHRLLIASGYHGEDHPISMGFLLDAERTPAPRRRRRAAHAHRLVVQPGLAA
ncbi:MAG: hypothetical protein RLZZ15_2433 [Verrucomicrobiota bacterium]|jgi:hypothetical protein